MPSAPSIVIGTTAPKFGSSFETSKGTLDSLGTSSERDGGNMPGGRSGGAATVLGSDYQSKVAAWLAVRALAGSAAAVSWGWPQHAAILSLHLETADEVDDIRVQSTLGDRAFLQVKHRVDAGRSEQSPLRKALNQFVRQDSSARDEDRFVLVTSSESSGPITNGLNRVLERVRRERSIDAATVCRNQSERTTFEVLTLHIKSSWQESSYGPPSDGDLLRVVSRLYITVADLEVDQPAAIEAEQHLRSALARPSQARAAWLDIVAAASDAAILQTGITPDQLAARLTDHGFGLGALADYRRDIETLLSRSEDGLSHLDRFRTVQGDDQHDVHVSRDLAELLVEAASGSFLITGDPGSGKSGALAGLVDSLKMSSDVVFLSADALAGSTINELRTELGLEHDITETLSHWFADRDGYLVIDALDAGRGSRTQDALLDLMARTIDLRGRWRVIATIRRFDLRANPALKQLFPGPPATADGRYQLDEFDRVRHFYVPGLSDLEFTRLADAAPRLGTAINVAPSALRELLRNPFCLRLFSDLIEQNQLNEPLFTRIDLLDEYWDWRIGATAATASRRELALRSICEAMLESGVLSVDRTEGAFADQIDAIAELLRDGVLTQTPGRRGGDGRIAFAHHVLFDYAVARLLLRGISDLTRMISGDDPRTLLMARPSLQMDFEHRWSNDRHDFWMAAVDLSCAEIPEIAKVIAPSVGAELVVADSDWQILVDLLDERRPDAIPLLRHLIGARLLEDSGVNIPEGRRPAWAHLCVAIAARLDYDVAPVVRALVREFVDGPMDDPALVEAVGAASRDLLEWCWSAEIQDRFYTSVAILGVIATYGSDPAASDSLLRRLIAHDHLEAVGYLELPSLARELRPLVRQAPALTRDVFIAAFEFEETSNEPTSLTTGVLSLTSNRRQDYESSHHSLTELFPEFLQADPHEAIAALSAIEAKFSLRYGGDRVREVFQVDWDGEPTRILEDHDFWAGDRDIDEEAQLMETFRSWLNEQIDAPDPSRFQTTLDELRSLEAPATLWRAVLASAADRVGRFVLLRPLLTSPSALTSTGLSQPIGEALREGFAALPPHVREAIETAIMSLPERNEDVADRLRRIRDRLVSSLPAASLQTPEARAHLSSLDLTDHRLENRPPVFFVEDTDDDDQWWVRDNGIDPEAPANALLLRLSEPLKSFNSEHLNTVPSPDEARAAWQQIQDAWDAINNPALAPTARLAEWATADVAEAVARICRSTLPTEFAAAEVEKLVRLTITLAESTSPQATQDLDAFDAAPHWSSAPRHSAAEAIMHLLRQGLNRESLIRSIEVLSRDPAVEVRFAIARGLGLLVERETELMWALIDDMSERDESGAVLERLVGLVRRLLYDQPDELLDRVSAIYARASTLGPRGQDARKACVATTTSRWIWRDEDQALGFTLDRINGSDEYVGDLEAVQRGFRSGFGATGVDSRRVLDRAFALALVVLDHVQSQIGQHNAGIAASASSGADTVRRLWHIIDAISNDVYFASGAYDTRRAEPDVAVTRVPIDTFYQSSKSLMHALTATPHPSIIHHVLETLDHLSPANPAEILLDMAGAVERGRQGGYEYDSLGASLMVTVVSRYLAQHRSLLQTRADCRVALVRILDTLVSAGWPEATRLTYQLDAAFR